MPLFQGWEPCLISFSQPFFHKIREFLCSLERKKPELSKTHPTFVFRPLLVSFMAYWTRITVFLGTPCSLYLFCTVIESWQTKLHSHSTNLSTVVKRKNAIKTDYMLQTLQAEFEHCLCSVYLYVDKVTAGNSFLAKVFFFNSFLFLRILSSRVTQISTGVSSIKPLHILYCLKHFFQFVICKMQCT